MNKMRCNYHKRYEFTPRYTLEQETNAYELGRIFRITVFSLMTITLEKKICFIKQQSQRLRRYLAISSTSFYMCATCGNEFRN